MRREDTHIDNNLATCYSTIDLSFVYPGTDILKHLSV